MNFLERKLQTNSHAKGEKKSKKKITKNEVHVLKFENGKKGTVNNVYENCLTSWKV